MAEKEVKGYTDEEINKLIKPIPDGAKGCYLQQANLRIKDPAKTIPFYCNILGMRLLQKLDYPQWKFSLYFIGHHKPEEIPKDAKERSIFGLSTPATLELTHNWGTESDPALHYHNGNSEPRGFAHLGVVVPNLTEAMARFEKEGVKIVKKPEEGNMRGLGFIADPDGYWIEIFEPKLVILN